MRSLLTGCFCQRSALARAGDDCCGNAQVALEIEEELNRFALVLFVGPARSTSPPSRAILLQAPQRPLFWFNDRTAKAPITLTNKGPRINLKVVVQGSSRPINGGSRVSPSRARATSLRTAVVAGNRSQTDPVSHVSERAAKAQAANETACKYENWLRNNGSARRNKTEKDVQALELQVQSLTAQLRAERIGRSDMNATVHGLSKNIEQLRNALAAEQGKVVSLLNEKDENMAKWTEFVDKMVADLHAQGAELHSLKATSECVIAQKAEIRSLKENLDANKFMMDATEGRLRDAEQQLRSSEEHALVSENRLSSAQRQIELMEKEHAAAIRIKSLCDQGIQVGNDFVKNEGLILRSIAGPATEASKAQRVIMMKVAGLCDSKSIQANGVGIVSTEQDKVLYVTSHTAVNPITMAEVQKAVMFAAAAIQKYESQQVPQGSVTVDSRMGASNAEQCLKTGREEESNTSYGANEDVDGGAIVTTNEAEKSHDSSQTYVKVPEAAAVSSKQEVHMETPAIQDKEKVPQKEVSPEYIMQMCKEDRSLHTMSERARLTSVKITENAYGDGMFSAEELRIRCTSSQTSVDSWEAVDVSYERNNDDQPTMNVKAHVQQKDVSAQNNMDVSAQNNAEIISLKGNLKCVWVLRAEIESLQQKLGTTPHLLEGSEHCLREAQVRLGKMKVEAAKMAQKQCCCCTDMKTKGDGMVSSEKEEKNHTVALICTEVPEAAAVSKEEHNRETPAIQDNEQVLQGEEVSPMDVMGTVTEERGLQTMSEGVRPTSDAEREKEQKVAVDPTPLSSNGHTEDVRYGHSDSVDTSSDKHSQTLNSNNASFGYTNGDISAEVEAKIGAGLQADSASNQKVESTSQSSSAHKHDNTVNGVCEKHVGRDEGSYIARFKSWGRELKSDIMHKLKDRSIRRRNKYL